MPLKFGVMPYFRFFTLMSPMLIASYALLQSAFNSDIKGVVFAMGAALLMFFGKMAAPIFPNRVPQDFDDACNIFETGDKGWGSTYSSPGPHQLFLWFAATYICIGMFVNSNVSWSLFGLFIVIIIGSGVIRFWQLKCVKILDLVLGAVFGSLWGMICYFLISHIEKRYDPPLDLTYFNANSDNEQCKLGPRAFRCKKMKKT